MGNRLLLLSRDGTFRRVRRVPQIGVEGGTGGHWIDLN